MTAESLKGKEVRDQYGNTLTVLNIVQNSVQVLEVNDYHHTTKLFYQGQSLYNLLNK